MISRPRCKCIADGKLLINLMVIPSEKVTGLAAGRKAESLGYMISLRNCCDDGIKGGGSKDSD